VERGREGWVGESRVGSLIDHAHIVSGSLVMHAPAAVPEGGREGGRVEMDVNRRLPSTINNWAIAARDTLLPPSLPPSLPPYVKTNRSSSTKRRTCAFFLGVCSYHHREKNAWREGGREGGEGLTSLKHRRRRNAAPFPPSLPPSPPPHLLHIGELAGRVGDEGVSDRVQYVLHASVLGGRGGGREEWLVE